MSNQQISRTHIGASLATVRKKIKKRRKKRNKEGRRERRKKERKREEEGKKGKKKFRKEERQKDRDGAWDIGGWEQSQYHVFIDKICRDDKPCW